MTMTGAPTPDDNESGIVELAAALRTLIMAIDRIEAATCGQPDAEFLAAAVAGCVRLVGMLAALAGVLRGLAQKFADAPAAQQPTVRSADPREAPIRRPMTEIVLDLASVRSLLHHALLVAAPTLADLRDVGSTPRSTK